MSDINQASDNSGSSPPDSSKSFWDELNKNPPSKDHSLSGIPYGPVPWIPPPARGGGEADNKPKNDPPPPQDNVTGNDDKPKTDPPPSQDNVTGNDDREKARDEMIHGGSGVEIIDKPTLQRDEAALRNVRNLLFDSNTSEDNKLRAAGVLAANGETDLKNDKGGTYKITREESSGLVSLTYQDTTEAKAKTISGVVAPDASLVKPKHDGVQPNDGKPEQKAPDAGAGPEDLKKRP